MRIRGFLCLLVSITTISAHADEIRIAASDILADYIKAPLEAFAEENSLELRIEGIGSLPAMDRLRSDEIDLCIGSLLRR